MPTRVQIIHDTSPSEATGDWLLAFQWCQYIHEDGNNEYGYRFIWRRDNGSLQPARGQARLPSIKQIEGLVNQAKQQGWGNLDGDG